MEQPSTPAKNAATVLAEALGKEQDGKLDESLARYDQAIASGIEDILIHSNRGMLLERLQRYEDALASFQRAAASESNFRDHYNAGNMLLTLNRHAEAIESYQASLVHRDDYPNCWVNQGIAHHALEQTRQAQASFEKAIELNKDFYPALRSLAILHTSTGHESQAIVLYQRAAEVRPGSADAWFEYGCALYKNLGEDIRFDPSGPEGQAMQALDKVIELAPDRHGAWGRKIGVLFRLSDGAQTTDNATPSETVPRLFPIIHNELLVTIEQACTRFPEDTWFAQRKKDAQNME